MKIIGKDRIAGHSAFWTVVATTDKSQVALMTLAPGSVSGEYGTDHPDADQALYCVSGSGEIESEGVKRTFSEGDLILIPAGEKHQVRGGSGKSPCVTLNFYGPPAYPDEG